jgi:hypothetical protein
MKPLNDKRVMPSRLVGLSVSVILSIGFIASLLGSRWALCRRWQLLGRLIRHAHGSTRAPIALGVSVILAAFVRLPMLAPGTLQTQPRDQHAPSKISTAGPGMCELQLARPTFFARAKGTGS